MPDYPDADLTLPSVVAALPGRYREPDLMLTIIFHPCKSRIGETAVVPPHADAGPWILGRGYPAFGRSPEIAGRPLEELHVSRQALALTRRAAVLTVSRLPASCRCRLAGVELETSAELDAQQLRSGVPILLGHSVLLLLRLAAGAGSSRADYAETSTLVGGSAYMLGLREQIAQAGTTDQDVLIRGETGTGKELVAGAIHRSSRRSSSPLISVNMAAIPPGLAAATLFGSARGAFTGAHSANDGYFAQAEGGSLFLDEIGDASPDVQPQLLRALQQREIQTVGGPIRRVDVRVISATDAALEGRESDFKAALRHRLGAFEIQLLPLREHPEDIGELLVHFLTGATGESGVDALLPTGKSPPKAIAAWAELFHSFLCYGWPGNVRQLANFSHQVALASREHLRLPENVRAALHSESQPQPVFASKVIEQPRRKLRDIDEAEFNRALKAHGYEVASTARQLRVSRQAVYRRIEDSPRHRLAGQVSREELERVLALHGGDAAATAGQLQVSLSGLRARLRGSGLRWF